MKITENQLPLNGQLFAKEEDQICQPNMPSNGIQANPIPKGGVANVSKETVQPNNLSSEVLITANSIPAGSKQVKKFKRKPIL